MKTPIYIATWKTALAAVMAAMLFAGTAQAATIAVNTFDDVIGDDGVCSLREAVIAANTNSPSGAVAGECAAGQAVPTVDVISLPAGTYTLSIPPEDSTPVEVSANDWQVGEYLATWQTSTYLISVTPDATKGDLDITESVNIVGAGEDLTIVDGGWAAEPWDVMAAGFDPKVDPVETNAGFGDRIFHEVSEPLAPNEAVTINVQMSGLTVKGGKIATVDGLLAPDEVSYSLRRNGGGVGTSVAAGTYDPAASSGGVPGGGGKGGPPVIEPGGEEGGATYTLALADMTIMSNYAGDGGGLYNAATASAANLTVSGNRSNANGGGIYNDAPMTITNSTVSGNSAEGGGAMFDTGSHLTMVTGSTFSGNGAVGGGGVSSRSGVTIIMVNSTVSGNYGFDVGGGVYTNGEVQLIQVTIANNVSNADSPGAGAGINTFPSGAAYVTLRNTLLANNFAGADPLTRVSANCGATGGAGNITSVGVNLGYNLSSDNTCLLWGTGDLQNLDAKILALADNGGPTWTHALDAGSPAINAASPVTQLTTDQRGVARDSVPDIGAYEYVVTATSGGGGGGGGGGCMITDSRSDGGPVDPTLPAIMFTAAMLIALSRRAVLRRRAIAAR